MSDKLPVGAAVRFTQDIYSPADDHSPAGYYAWRGGLATVKENDGRFWDYYVTDRHGHSFGVTAAELELAPVENKV